jgi:hypothetical protein
MNYKKFNGKKIEDVAKHRKDISSYNNNYYEDAEGNIIYQWSDDDNYADYTRVTITGNSKILHETFAESFCSCGDILEVFDEFMNEDKL